jgi:hypothetical protein
MATSPLPHLSEDLLARCISKSQSRVELWVELIRSFGVQNINRLFNLTANL